MKRCWLFVLLLLFASACHLPTSNIEQRIGNKINDFKKGSDSIIRVSNVTDFKWDTMYVFAEAGGPGFIEKNIGHPFTGYQEFSRVNLFIKDGKIVYFENNANNIEGIVPGQVIFNYPDSLPCMKYTPASAIFKAKVRKQSGDEFYELNRLK